MLQLSEDQVSGKLIVHINEGSGNTSLVNVSSFSILGKDAERLLIPMLRYLDGVRPASQKGFLACFNWVGEAFREWGLSQLPVTESGWQDLVSSLYEFVLSRPDRAVSLKTRIKIWSRITQFLELIRDSEDIIPIGVEIPHAPSSLEAIDTSSYMDRLLGEIPPKVVQENIDKTLVPVSLARTDAHYLEEIRNQLANRRTLLHKCLLAWWSQVKAHFEFGQQLLKQVDYTSLKTRLDKGQSRIGDPVFGRHLANGPDEVGFGNLLAVIHHEFDGFISHNKSKHTDRIPCLVFVNLPRSAPESISEHQGVMRRINWMMGNLSEMDITVCIALLLMHNPKFTPHALMDARVTDKEGKPYLELGDQGYSFRVDKARAKAMKEEVLDDLSLEIIQALLSMTANSRSRLKDRNPSLANRLFFYLGSSGRSGYRAPRLNSIVRFLTGAHSNKFHPFFSCFPELEVAGLGKGTITFKKIRATEGVLEWFRTGSLVAMTRKLGNTKKIVLEHYLPKPLLVAWNTRLVRRFQNLWLAVAAANEDFLLAATDFNSLEDLHAFLVDMLSLHAPNSSPLAEELHRRFGNLSVTAETQDCGELHVPISKNTLGALYLYQESALEAGLDSGSLDQQDLLTGLSPRSVINLAELLRHQLPAHRDPEYRQAHETALFQMESKRYKVNWGDLFLR